MTQVNDLTCLRRFENSNVYFTLSGKRVLVFGKLTLYSSQYKLYLKGTTFQIGIRFHFKLYVYYSSAMYVVY